MEIPCVVISLKESEARRSQASKVLTSWPQMQFFLADRHVHGGAYGCYDSHVQVLTQLNTLDAEFVAVFEDDVTKTIHCDKYLNSAIRQFQESSFDMLYMGSNELMWACDGGPYDPTRTSYLKPVTEPTPSYIGEKRFQKS